jgi:hypothetical protein
MGAVSYGAPAFSMSAIGALQSVTGPVAEVVSQHKGNATKVLCLAPGRTPYSRGSCAALPRPDPLSPLPAIPT